MEPKYKIGDKVIIKKTRSGSPEEYRFSFTDEMMKYGGKIFTIESIRKADDFTASPVPDDGYKYSLEEVGFMWASSMFEDGDDEQTLVVDSLSSSSCESDDDIDVFVKKRKCPELDFNL